MASPARTTIVVYGATGTTGRLIARSLALGGAPVVVAGRDRGRAEALGAELGVPARAAAVSDPAGLAAVFADAAVVISCAGPYRTIGEAVVEAALAAGASYLDTAGEQAFLRAVYERFDSAARRAGVAVVPGMAFEIALGDWAAAWAARALCGEAADPAGDVLAVPTLTERLADGTPIDEIAVGYALDDFAPTPGTALSMIESVLGDGVEWLGDRWDPVAPARDRRRINFGAAGERDALSFPSGEVITVPRHVATRRVTTLVAPTRHGWMARIGQLLSPAAPLARGAIATALRARVEPGAPSAETRARAAFTVQARARRGFKVAQVAVSGRDVYAVSATIAAWAAQRLASRRGGPVGVLAPAQLLAPAAALTEIAGRAGLIITTSFG